MFARGCSARVALRRSGACLAYPSRQPQAINRGFVGINPCACPCLSGCAGNIWSAIILEMKLTSHVVRCLPVLALLFSSGCFLFISAPNDLPNGTRTDDHGEACHSGFASQGYCCDRACDAACESCAAADTGVPNGTCAPVLTARDPYNSCGDGRSCDGAGACAWISAGGCTTDNECMTGFCRDNTCCENTCDGLCMSCSLALNGIADGLCRATLSGLETDNECWGPVACDGGGGCYANMPGTPCSANFECMIGMCNGACCNDRCDGICKICAVTGSGYTAGACVDVPNGTNPNNECPNAVCNGAGRCDVARPGTPCNNDSDCSNGDDHSGVCCDQRCHWWTDTKIQLSAEETLVRPPASALGGPVFALEDGTALAAVSRETPEPEARLLAYDGALWSETGVKGSGANAGRFGLYRGSVSGSHATQIIAILYRADGTSLYRFDGNTKNWSLLASPNYDAINVQVIDGGAFYVSGYFGISRWENNVYTSVKFPGDVMIGGMTSSRGTVYAWGSPDNLSSVAIYQLQGLTAVLLNDKLPMDNFRDIRDLVTPNVFWLLRGNTNSPTYLAEAVSGNVSEMFELTKTGLVSVPAALRDFFVSCNGALEIAGPVPNVFCVPNGSSNEVRWSFELTTWGSTSLPLGNEVLQSISAGSTCSAFAASTTHVFGF